ncbi:adenylate/guanylate cyclase domain-containing protein [Yoonia sp. SS1-5]|uniref:Adenylate/guanylate cyclase domain-containing protein n=1 Tax=Yoonia rhodophyticola TaxID=3137370 RepID=A0AAN0MAV0_9RHOB
MTVPEVSPAVHGRGERKQITAVFIDVVGFSDIASTADAEDLEVWLEDYYEQSRQIVEAHDGEVTEYLGDGVVALFGLSQADELTAPKAVNAAIKAVTEINTGYQGKISVQLRAGVATGEVAVRANRGGSLPRATGMVTTLAQRIQERATPGTVMIAESTKLLLRGGLAIKAVPDQQLKGFAEAQTLYQPSHTSAVAQEAEASSFFVGRRAELDRIAANNRPSLIIGQAGMGKTALTQKVAAGADAVTTIAADGVHTRASYQPFNDWLIARMGGGLPSFDDIKKKFPTLDLDTQRALALSLGLPDGQRLLAEKSNVAVKALIENSFWQAIQIAHPKGLLIVEDLHWLDNASFGVLVAILNSADPAVHQILMTSREDTKISKYLEGLPIDMIPLDKMDDADARSMLAALSNGAVAEDKQAALIEKAAGVPLFLSQLFQRSLTEEGEDGAIPGSLMDLLAAQIDATGPSKQVLQCGAVIGRNFDLPTLRAIASEHEPLIPHLDKACARGVLDQESTDTWTFSHALLHQAAYQGLLRRTRIAYHSDIASYLQEHRADAVHRNPTILADHLSLAQQHVPAVQNYLAVSQWALFQGAFDDAEAHVLAALSLCEEAPDDVDMTDLEIACHTALGSIHVQTMGFTADPAKQAFEEVERLATTKAKYSAANCPAFYGSFSHAILSGDRAGAVRFGNMFLDTLANVPDADEDSEIRIGSYNVQVALNFYSGNFQQQFKDFAALREVYDITKHGAMITNYGVDIFAAAQMFEPVGRAIVGDTHLVDPLSAETDEHQVKLNIPVMEPYAKIWGAVPLYYAGQTDRAIARVKEGIATAHSQTAAFWQITGAAWLNVMDPAQSETDEGLAGFDTVIKTHEAVGALVGLPYFRAHYAVALARHDRFEEAYQSSYRAVRECEASGLHCWFPEVLRLHAKVCQMSRRFDDANIYVARAIDVAKKQGALLWSLRALLDQHALGVDNTATLRDICDALPKQAPPPELAQAQAILDAA